MGTVDAKIKSVSVFGYMAVVQTVEVIGPGVAFKTVKRKGDGNSEVAGGVQQSILGVMGMLMKSSERKKAKVQSIVVILNLRVGAMWACLGTVHPCNSV